jgi:hypothetical protein
MKKMAGLSLLLLLMTMAGRVMAQNEAAPAAQTAPATQSALTAVATATLTPAVAQGVPAAQPTTQSTPGMPLIYFSLGSGSALIGNGFGTEGNPWIDKFSGTLANGYGTSFNPSLAFILLLGFNLDKNWSVNLSMENYAFAGTQSSASNEENIIPSLRYTFDFGPVSPYVTAGYGFNFNTTSVTAPTTVVNNITTGQLGYTSDAIVNSVVSGGVGLLLKVAGDYSGHAYIGAQYQQVFTAQGSFSYYPLIIGYQYP